MIEALNDLNNDELLLLQKEIDKRLIAQDYVEFSKFFKGLSIMEEKTYHEFYDEYLGTAVRYDGDETYFVIKGSAVEAYRFIRKYQNALSYARDKGLSS